MRLALILVSGAIVAYLAVGLALYAGQRRMLFPASAFRATAAEAGLDRFRDLVLETSDGERLVAWWVPPEPGRALVLFFHGNGSTLWNRRDRARLLSRDGRGLLIVSYRGYSGSSGSPSEEGLQLDAEAAYRFLGSYESRRIVLYGESLGTGVAIRLATAKPVGGVILDAPYTAIDDVAAPMFPFLPVKWLLRDRFPSIERISDLRAPLLVLHGERDGLIPIALAERLYAAANEPKRFVRLPGVVHHRVLEEGGLAPVRAFLDEVEAGFATAKQP